MKKFTKLQKRMMPSANQLASIGLTSDRDVILDVGADPECQQCNGTGQVLTPDRVRGGHVCPCCLTTEAKERRKENASV